MSILNTSVSGMLANTNWLSTISQNVANSNTTAYKDIETDFSALVSGSQSSGPPGAGVTTTTTALNQLQGQLQQTSTTTDLAIQGAGYFVVTDSLNNIYLTRDGSFTADASGNLVNAGGYFLMGAPASTTASGAPLNSLSSLVKINISGAGDTSIPSTQASIVANLPSTAPIIAPANLPSTNSAGATFTNETSLVAYDDLGAPHTVNIYYAKTATGSWEADVYDASGAAAGGGFPYSAGPLATQTLTFSSTTGAISTGSPMTFTTPAGQKVILDMSQTTQLASGFAVSSATINGAAPGTQTGVSIAQNGTLSFEYGNGSTPAVYIIPVAKVAAPDQLSGVKGDAFLTNYSSGAPQVGIAGTAGLGTVNSSSLEQSTVDLATELTSMVQAQSAYEANSKVFQAGAKLLDVLNNIQA